MQQKAITVSLKPRIFNYITLGHFRIPSTDENAIALTSQSWRDRTSN
ncbi:hypothetical protein [Nostoc commune]|nr:hypothetical protein [Nostoc commune]